MRPRRLSLCYAAPGHSLLTTAGATRNMLAVASALSEFADVTLAFRRIPCWTGLGRYNLVAIETESPDGLDFVDGVTARGLNPLAHLSYLRKIEEFARRRARAFDVVLEKGWLLSGALLAAFRRHGLPGVLVENDVHPWTDGFGTARTIMKYGLHLVAQRRARRHSRRVPIIAETEELKSMLVRLRGVPPDLIEVVGLGVDHALFRPLDQASVRQALGIPLAVPVLLYVGAIDKYHDLRPIIDGLRAAGPLAAEFHVVGDGVDRAAYEALTREAGVAVRFHGSVPHREIPEYIAAADVCVAPYRAAAFEGGTVPFSTLKIPEYMACARPVISIPSGHIAQIVEHGVAGFLFPNEVSAWTAFLADFPSRDELAERGRAAAKAVESLSWEETAARYFAICHRVAATRGNR